MLKLYKVIMTHFAPKDYESAIEEYIVANNDKEVFNYLAYGYAGWVEISDECTKNEIYENRGDYRDAYDTYYGATKYRWEEVELVDDKVIDLMIVNGLAKDVRGEMQNV